jgi:hypothetical protein
LNLLLASPLMSAPQHPRSSVRQNANGSLVRKKRHRIKVSRYMLSKKQRRKYENVGEIRISIWGRVPSALDQLLATQLWGNNRAQVYYYLAMAQLRQIELSDPGVPKIL